MGNYICVIGAHSRTSSTRARRSIDLAFAAGLGRPQNCAHLTRRWTGTRLMDIQWMQMAKYKPVPPRRLGRPSGPSGGERTHSQRCYDNVLGGVAW